MVRTINLCDKAFIKLIYFWACNSDDINFIKSLLAVKGFIWIFNCRNLMKIWKFSTFWNDELYNKIRYCYERGSSRVMLFQKLSKDWLHQAWLWVFIVNEYRGGVLIAAGCSRMSVPMGACPLSRRAKIIVAPIRAAPELPPSTS